MLESEGFLKENTTVNKIFHQLLLGAITWRAFQIILFIFSSEVS